MTELLKKDTKFIWTEECEASFQELKKCLVTSPVLILLDQTKDYEVYCDASRRGLGAVLMQEELCHMLHDNLNPMRIIMLRMIWS